MSILLRKRREVVVALLKRDLTRVETFARLKPASVVMLEHALTAIAEWRERIGVTLRECFEDARIGDDVTSPLSGTLTQAMADLANPGGRQLHPVFAYKSVFARVTRAKARVEKLLQDLDLYEQPDSLPPLTKEESALITAEHVRTVQQAMANLASPRPPPEPERPSRRESAPARSSRAIFISHSTRDQQVAEKLVDLLTAAFEPPLSRADIMCTSVPGCTLEGGARTDERLLEEIKAAPVFIGLITTPSVNSGYVLFELGARWAVDGGLTVPVLGPACTPDLLPGPWKNVNAHRTYKRDRVLQLVNEIAEALKRRPQPSHTWDNRVDALVQRQEPKLTSGDFVIEGSDLKRLAEVAAAYHALLEGIGDQRDSRIVNAAIQVGELDLALLRDHDAVKDQIQKIFDRGQKLDPALEVRVARIERDEEHGCDSIVFQTIVARAPRETRLDFDYLAGPEWGELAALHAALAEVGSGPYRVETGRGEYELRDIFEAVQVLRRDGAVS